MQLTTHIDYALRLLIYLAVHQGPELPTVQEAADRYRISGNHLAKVTQHLVQHGYIAGRRGRGGGLVLARAPADINVGELVRQLESFELVECLGAGSRCRIEEHCQLRTAIEEATVAFLDSLERYTLEDLIRPRAKIIKMLRMSNGGARRRSG